MNITRNDSMYIVALRQRGEKPVECKTYKKKKVFF